MHNVSFCATNKRMQILYELAKKYQKTDIPEISAGDVVVVYQKVKEGDKERIQQFEGLVLATKHGRGISGTITLRKVSDGIGVERVFPIHSPTIEKIKVVKHAKKVHRSKLYFIRGKAAKEVRKKIMQTASVQQKA